MTADTLSSTRTPSPPPGGAASGRKAGGPLVSAAAMPSYRKFDTQIRFGVTSQLKAQLDREAERRRMSTADLVRLLLEEWLAMRHAAKRKRTG